MCLAIQVTIVAIENGEGVIDYRGVRRRGELMLVPQAKAGDRVIVHAGFAIAVLDEQAGEELTRLTAETSLHG